MTVARSLSPLLLGLATAAAPWPGQAQEAFTYLVRDAGQDARWSDAGDEAFEGIDVSGDRNPMRVIQGPEVTWVIPEGVTRPPSLEDAAMVLYRNQPVRHGAGNFMVRGWPSALSFRYDTVGLELRRGGHDRELAGRWAHHYELRAVIRRAGSGASPGFQELRYAAHLWILPELPHSWAPFGFGARSLTGFSPRLRDELGHRLKRLGLVAKAVTRLEFGDGGHAPSSRVRAFEVTGIEPSDPPPDVGIVLDRAVLEALDRRILDEPGAICSAVARGELPPGGPEVDGEARKLVIARVHGRCGSPEIYFNMVRERLESDAEALCGAVARAAGPVELANAIFTDSEHIAFMEILSAADRQSFLVELRQYCRGR